MWRVLPEHPNVFIDTAVVEPGRPHRPVHARRRRARSSMRATRPTARRMISARDRAAVRAAGRPRRRPAAAVAGGQLERMLDGEEPARGGPPTGESSRWTPCTSASSPTCLGDGPRVRRRDPDEPVALARLACAVGDDVPAGDVFASRARAARPLRRAPRRAADRRPAVPAAGRFSSRRWSSHGRPTWRSRRRTSRRRAPRPSGPPAPSPLLRLLRRRRHRSGAAPAGTCSRRTRG